jgi:exodeoxyribonuclease VII large subunit
VTSKAAAGLADMLKVLRRFPFLRVIVVHVPVQGAGAAAGIARALDGVNKHHESFGGVDVILLGRGGGSYEDLFEFSREEVARAVARSGIPIITGIGHEVDVAIADLVADHHAHTPTAAAEYAVRMWEAADEFVRVASGKLRREMSRTMSDAVSRLRQVERHAFFARPEELTARRHQRIDDREGKLEIAQRNRLLKLRRRLDAVEAGLAKHDPRRVLIARRDRLFKAEARLGAAMAGRFRRIESRLTQAQGLLARRGPQQKLALATQRLKLLEQRAPRAVALVLRQATERVTALDAQLRVLGPESVLSRGFTITTRAESGEVVRDAGALRAGDTLRTRFAGGEVDSVVKS